MAALRRRTLEWLENMFSMNKKLGLRNVAELCQSGRKVLGTAWD
jgi:hypothetical protein